MEIKDHPINNRKIAEVDSSNQIISSIDDGIQLLGNLYFQGYDHIVIQEHHISPDFFDLKTGIAGEILQKFSTYRVRLAIVGDFKKYTGKSINAFILESNKTGHILFVSSVQDALNQFSK